MVLVLMALALAQMMPALVVFVLDLQLLYLVSITSF